MQLVVLTVLAYAAVTSAQLGIGGFGAVGSKVGSKVGADIGLLTGTVLDTMPGVIGMASTPDVPQRGRRPNSPGRKYSRQGSESEYEKEEDIIRERTVYETERIRGRESGRSRQGSERVRAGGRSSP